MRYEPRPFTKKPVTITAVQWDGTARHATYIIDWILRNGGTARYVARGESHSLRYPEEIIGTYNDREIAHKTASAFIMIDTLEGAHRMNAHDYAIKGVEAEFYPCKPGIFDKTYNPGDSSKLMPLKDASLSQLVAAMGEQMDAIAPGWREVDSTDQAAVDAHVEKAMGKPKNLGSYGSALR